MEQYLIDTNIISDYFSDSFPAPGMQFMDTVIDATPNLSVISQIELLSWVTDSDSEQKVKDFIEDSVVLEISPDTITHCVNLRRARKIKTPDAIIAATALALEFTLITNNEKDFAKIPGLKIVNPHKI